MNVPLVQVYDTETDSWARSSDLPDRDDFEVFGASGTVIGDTIFYYGGANDDNFGTTKVLRTGVVDTNNHLRIRWSTIKDFTFLPLYRPAATNINGRPVWLGGSNVSYNFDGIAYNGSGGVAPANSIQVWPGDALEQWTRYRVELPMDLRSVASLNDSVKILVGGMISDQVVSNKTVRLVFSSQQSSDSESPDNGSIQVYPNPSSENWFVKMDDLMK